MRSYFFILLSTFLFCAGAFGQTDSLKAQKEVRYDQREIAPHVHFKKKKLQDYRQDRDYDYTEKVQAENWWTLFKEWLTNRWHAFWHWLLGDYSAGSFVQLLIMVLPYLIIGGIIGLIIWLFIRLNPGASMLSSKKKGDVFLSEEEKIMAQTDLAQLIEKARNQKNYRLAIRYYYLLILKKLREKEMIHYEFQKTNHDYLNEISSEVINRQFKNITHLYDFIWYGSFPVSLQDYKIAEKEFSKIKQQLSSQTNG